MDEKASLSGAFFGGSSAPGPSFGLRMLDPTRKEADNRSTLLKANAVPPRTFQAAYPKEAPLGDE